MQRFLFTPITSSNTNLDRLLKPYLFILGSVMRLEQIRSEYTGNWCIRWIDQRLGHTFDDDANIWAARMRLCCATGAILTARCQHPSVRFVRPFVAHLELASEFRGHRNDNASQRIQLWPGLESFVEKSIGRLWLGFASACVHTPIVVIVLRES